MLCCAMKMLYDAANLLIGADTCGRHCSSHGKLSPKVKLFLLILQTRCDNFVIWLAPHQRYAVLHQVKLLSTWGI